MTVDVLVPYVARSSACAITICFRKTIITSWVNTLRPRQNGRHFPDDIFIYIFFNKSILILTKISLKFVPNGPINNIPALDQIMAWRRPGDKPLSEPMMVSLQTHTCVTWTQWVNIPPIFTCRFVSNHICIYNHHIGCYFPLRRRFVSASHVRHSRYTPTEVCGPQFQQLWFCGELIKMFIFKFKRYKNRDKAWSTFTCTNIACVHPISATVAVWYKTFLFQLKIWSIYSQFI